MREQHRLIIDRFEGDLAVVHVGGERMLDLPRWLLPRGAGEGDVIVATRAADADDVLELRVEIDAEASERGREEARRLLDELDEGEPGGEVSV